MAPHPVTLPKLVELLVHERRTFPPSRALLVGLSGIDGAGKGWVAHQLANGLEHRVSRIAVLNVDGWLNLPSVRFNAKDPARHFYTHALRLEAFRLTASAAGRTVLQSPRSLPTALSALLFPPRGAQSVVEYSYTRGLVRSP